MTFVADLIKEEFIQPKLDKYDIPKKYIDKNFGFYYITLKTNDMIKLRRALYEIPVLKLISDKNDQIYSKS